MMESTRQPPIRWIAAGSIVLSAACVTAPRPAEERPQPVATDPPAPEQVHVEFGKERSVPAEPARVRPARTAPHLLVSAPVRISSRPTERSARALGVDAETASLRARLGATRMRSIVVKDEESLRAVIALVRDSTGLPLVVTPGAEQAALDEGIVFDFELQNSITVKNLLNLIKRQANGSVIWKIQHEAVILTTADKAAQTTALVTHDIRGLTMVRTDFIAPRIDRLRLLDELEDDDGGGPFGSIGEQAQQMEEDDVAALVQENIEPGSWDRDGVSIEASNGFLFVRHTPDVQRRVARFLESLGP